MSVISNPINHRVDALMGQYRPMLEASIAQLEDLNLLRQRWSLEEATPVVVEARENGVDHSWGGMDVRTLLHGEQSGGRFSVHNIELAPGAGLPAHYHRDAHATVLVLEGKIELRVGNQTECVSKYGLGYIPPMTRLAFRNQDEGKATIVIVYWPAGVDRAFDELHRNELSGREQNPQVVRRILERFGFVFDEADLPNDQLTNVAVDPLDFEVQEAGDLEELREQFRRSADLPRLVKTTAEEFGSAPKGFPFRKGLLMGEESAGNAMLNLLSGPPGFKAGEHFQPTEEEFFFIVDGELHMRCGTASVALKPGAFAFAPRNCTHAFTNKSASDQVRFITLNSPAGHERSMSAVRRLKENGGTQDQLHQLASVGGFVFHSKSSL